MGSVCSERARSVDQIAIDSPDPVNGPYFSLKGMVNRKFLQYERQSFGINLGWTDNATNETGYRVYRNAQLIATLGANATSYTDNPPGSGPYSYGVQAFNDVGTSGTPTVEEEGCIF